MHSISQKRLFLKRVYTVNENDNSIDVFHKSYDRQVRFTIAISEIGDEVQLVKQNKLGVYIFSTFIFLLATGLIILTFFIDDEAPIAYSIIIGMGYLLAAIILFYPYQDDVQIVGGEQVITLFRKSPTEREVSDFVAYLQGLVLNYRKEILINNNLDEDVFMSNISWMLNMNYLTPEEYDQVKHEYDIQKLF